MAIAFGSINTGLPKDIVKQIMAAEKIPINKMEQRKEKFGDKQKLLNELTQLVESLRKEVGINANARSLREFSVMTNEDLVGVNVDKNIAEPGSYQFEVVQLAQKSSAMSSGFEDPDEDYLGVGFIQYFLPNGETKDVYIDSEHSSLRGIAKIINSDNENGMRAFVVNDGSGAENPWRVIISLDDTGDDKLAEFPYFYLVDGVEDFYIEFEREAHDAVVKLDGFEIEVPENKANDLIPGVNIDLKKASPGEEFTIQIKEDSQAIADKLEGMFKNINDILRFIKVQNTMDENTDTQRTLGGDITLQTIESRLRSTVFRGVSTDFGMKRIGDFGVTFQRDGLLKFDRNKFESSLKNNYKLISQVLSGRFNEDGEKEVGFIDNLSEVAKSLLQFPNGVLSTRKQGIQSKIDGIDRQIANRERALEQKEKNLKNKFARLEGTISRIKNSGAGLAALSAQAPNPVTQLG